MLTNIRCWVGIRIVLYCGIAQALQVTCVGVGVGVGGCVHACVHTCVRVYICVCACLYCVYMCTYIHACVCACMSLCVCSALPVHLRNMLASVN